MQGILGAAAEGASGTREDGKEALKVCVCLCVSVFKVKMSKSKFNKLHQNSYSCVLAYMISAGPSSVFKIVKMIMERNFQPVIIFSFSKKECEAYALQVAKLDFNRGMCTRAAIQQTVVLFSQVICMWM